MIRLRDKSSSGRAYARDKNTSAGLCAKNAGGAYARGGVYLRDTTVHVCWVNMSFIFSLSTVNTVNAEFTSLGNVALGLFVHSESVALGYFEQENYCLGNSKIHMIAL